MDALIVSIAIAIALGLAAHAEDRGEDEADEEPGDSSAWDRPDDPDGPASEGDVPNELKAR